jgi:hypothetical protein
MSWNTQKQILESNTDKGRVKTCASLNLTSGQDKSPVMSCSMYSKTRYMLHDNREVINPSNFMMLGWSSLRRINISLAINRTLSGSKLSNRTFFRATILPVSVSRARNTLLYVPCPIYQSNCTENKLTIQLKRREYKLKWNSSSHLGKA